MTERQRMARQLVSMPPDATAYLFRAAQRLASALHSWGLEDAGRIVAGCAVAVELVRVAMWTPDEAAEMIRVGRARDAGKWPARAGEVKP
jgi:hypothetical protein